ncbi:fatty acyl-CoA reductase 1-like [Oryza brachyantha]|uniref:fatty acyl-CoA reductase 1-like n=1 Tax=Oryza brachyantha TaxID=4533 RepID=UPI001ADACE49|nr:fatty acyl-CoA reductase 1-like [Oryza brachyantha]
MMADRLDAERIIEYFKGKSILITGATGFLGKILVEKILRVQPDVKKIYLLVRAIDEASAKQRVQSEVTETELFSVVKEKHGKGFEEFIEEKVVALAGDIIYDDLGLEPPVLHDLAGNLDVIVNGAATTNFYGRYDVSLDVNVLGVKHLCQLAKKCRNLKVFLHVSTAYAGGDQEGLIQERAFEEGWALREGMYLDVEAELRLVADVRRRVDDDDKAQRKAMKELGLARARHFGWSNTYVFTKAMGEMVLSRMLLGGEGGGGGAGVVVVRPSIITSVLRDPVPGWMQGTRTIDTLIIGYAKQNLPCFLGDLDLVMDVIPGDMVVNAMMAATVAHSGERWQGQEGRPAVYHVSSSLRNPAAYWVLYEAGRRHFTEKPRTGKRGEVIPTKEMHFFKTIASFQLYMLLKYRLPLELLHLLNLLLCGLFSRLYSDLATKYRYVMHLVDVYGPFAFFKGCFDDINLERLRQRMGRSNSTEDDDMFNFDPKTIDWEDYFYRIHIPGVLKYILK